MQSNMGANVDSDRAWAQNALKDRREAPLEKFRLHADQARMQPETMVNA